jgi:hypothetical protein
MPSQKPCTKVGNPVFSAQTGTGSFNSCIRRLQIVEFLANQQNAFLTVVSMVTGERRPRTSRSGRTHGYTHRSTNSPHATPPGVYCTCVSKCSGRNIGRSCRDSVMARRCDTCRTHSPSHPYAFGASEASTIKGESRIDRFLNSCKVATFIY